MKPGFVLSGQSGQQVSKALKIKPATMLSGQYGQQISETYRGGSECAFTPLTLSPCPKTTLCSSPIGHQVCSYHLNVLLLCIVYAISTLWLGKFGSDLKL